MPATEAPSLVSQVLEAGPGVHAVLFYGNEGAGMVDAALALAQGWLCPKGGCGGCPVCRSFEGGRMVDFMHYRPWGPSNILKVWAVRPQERAPWDEERPEPSLREFLRTPPLMARYKVALFEDAHRMNSEASNSLLKTLEEPPPYAKVVLATPEFSRVYPTVRSRCLSVACPVPDTQGDEEVARVFAPTPGMKANLGKARDAYTGLWEVFESSLTAPRGAYVALSERTREAAEGLVKPLATNPRGANAEALRCLAEWLAVRRPAEPELAQAAVDAHRLVLGNLNPGPVFDHLWWRIVAD